MFRSALKMVVCVLACGWLAVGQVGGTDEYEAALAVIRQYNGTCLGKPLKRVEVAGMLVNDRFLAVMPALDSLEDLRIQRCRLSEQGLASLEKFPMLNTLSLSDDLGITAEGIGHLTNLTHLATLNITVMGVDTAIAPALSAIPELWHLLVDPGPDWTSALTRVGATNISVVLSLGAPAHSAERIAVGEAA